MDASAILERLKPHWIPITLGLVGMMFLGYGLLTLATPKDTKGEITFEAASDVSPLVNEAKNTQITVDVSGAVEKPGVYDLPSDARVQDALIAAGGMNNEADREKVAKGLNLAAKLTDGGKIYIPRTGEQALASSGETAASSGQALLGTQTSSSDMININTASASELDKLQGVGQITAEKIISNRPYGKVEELLTKKVVGQKVFEQMKTKISVY
jgi:competence protein ComEA